MKTKGISELVINLVEGLTPLRKRIIWLVLDGLSILLSIILGALFFYKIIDLSYSFYFVFFLLSFLIYMLLSHYSLLDIRLNRYSGIFEFSQLFFITSLSVLFGGIICITIFQIEFWRLIIFSMIVASLLCVAWRVLWQIIYLSRFKFLQNDDTTRRVILVGAGDGGNIFLSNYQRKPGNMEVVGILDRDTNKHGKLISGIEVLGDIDLIPEIAEKYGANEIIVAIPSIKPEEYEEILKIANPYHLKLFKMPAVEDVIQGNYKPLSINKVNIADLLGRKEVVLDESKLRAELEGKTILITGAGGSIGSEITRQVSKFGPKRIILLGHGENSIYTIYHELNRGTKMVEYVPTIADIRDYNRILEIFEEEKPDIVYHAAAHKHVPLMEYNPVEAYKNNILGTYNVAKAVDKCGVPKMVMISTDKAINPPNVMGASKRIAELIITGFNEKSTSNYSAVRFGNVLGSRGSVIPVFEKQIAAGGPVTVTDFRMTRYFMTIPEASRLVIYSGAFAKGGEVFVLNMGEPVKILDLAKKLILLSGFTEDEIDIIETGIRPGEKLFEEILTTSESISEQVDNDIFIGKVRTVPLEELDDFIESLSKMSANDMKKAIINYANQSVN